VGLYWLEFKRQSAGVLLENTNGIKFGGKVLAGYQTSSKLYLELEYTLPGAANARMFYVGVGLKMNTQ
jgi:hypothetical protein